MADIYNSFTFAAVDDLMATIDRERERVDAILYYILPLFDDVRADKRTMKRIEWDYSKVRVMMQMIQDSMETLQVQEERWGRIVESTHEQEQKEGAAVEL